MAAIAEIFEISFLFSKSFSRFAPILQVQLKSVTVPGILILSQAEFES